MAETTALTLHEKFTGFLENRVKPALAQAAGDAPVHLDRVVAVVRRQVLADPKLAACLQTTEGMRSIGDAMVEVVQTGLEPTGPIGGAYLVPFKGKVTVIYAYQGLVELARRSGEIKDIYAEVVREKDHFRVSYGLERKLEHVPDLEAEDPGEVRFAYAVAHLKDGGVQFAVLPRREIERRRRSAGGQKAQPSGVWAEWYDEMAKKTAIRALAKLLPRSVRRLHEVLAREDMVTAPEAAPTRQVEIDVTPGSGQTRTEGLKDALRQDQPDDGPETLTFDAEPQEPDDEPEPEPQSEPEPPASTKPGPVPKALRQRAYKAIMDAVDAGGLPQWLIDKYGIDDYGRWPQEASRAALDAVVAALGGEA